MFEDYGEVIDRDMDKVNESVNFLSSLVKPGSIIVDNFTICSARSTYSLMSEAKKRAEGYYDETGRTDEGMKSWIDYLTDKMTVIAENIHIAEENRGRLMGVSKNLSDRLDKDWELTDPTGT